MRLFAYSKLDDKYANCMIVPWVELVYLTMIFRPFTIYTPLGNPSIVVALERTIIIEDSKLLSKKIQKTHHRLS